MSIAVSAVVRPSPALCRLQAVFCACVMASAVCCGGWLAAALCVAGGGTGWMACYRKRSAYRIDISGDGRIRLAVYKIAGKQTAVQDDRLAGDGAGATMRMLAGSTLWPGLLLLRLQGDDGPVVSLPIVPDSVARHDYRALALACRAVAARGETLRTDGAGPPIK